MSEEWKKCFIVCCNIYIPLQVHFDATLCIIMLDYEKLQYNTSISIVKLNRVALVVDVHIKYKNKWNIN